MWKILALFALICAGEISCQAPTPIVLWHGMGDSCCNPVGLGWVKRQLKKAIPGVHVVSLKIGKNVIDDTMNGFLLHPDKQIDLACDIVQKDPLLAGGYNAIGFSQGSQFLRGLLQRCPEPRMLNLVTLGGQHQGVYGIPTCPGCDPLRELATKILYHSDVQQGLAQATFWHYPINATVYRAANTFIADINNDFFVNESYIARLNSLENLVMVKFESDQMVQPRESQWFGFYAPGQARETQSLQESRVYDRLGLRQMDLEGKLHFLSTPGRHLVFDWDWFVENVVERFLK